MDEPESDRDSISVDGRPDTEEAELSVANGYVYPDRDRETYVMGNPIPVRKAPPGPPSYPNPASPSNSNNNSNNSNNNSKPAPPYSRSASSLPQIGGGGGGGGGYTYMPPQNLPPPRQPAQPKANSNSNSNHTHTSPISPHAHHNPPSQSPSQGHHPSPFIFPQHQSMANLISSSSSSPSSSQQQSAPPSSSHHHPHQPYMSQSMGLPSHPYTSPSSMVLPSHPYASPSKDEAEEGEGEGEGEEDEVDNTVALEYHVTKENKYGVNQNRIIVLSREKKSFVLVDAKTRNTRKDIKLEDVASIDIPKDQQNQKSAPLTLGFSEACKQRPFKVYFVEEFERLHFCQEMTLINPAIKVTDNSGTETSRECLRFKIIKINRAGVEKNRIIALRSKGRVIQSYNRSKKPDKEIHFAEIAKIVRSLEKRRVDVYFKYRQPTNFIFEDSAHRERFLGRAMQLWEIEQSMKRKIKMKQPVEEFIPDPDFKLVYPPLSVYVTSWNVGGSSPPSDSAVLTSWLGPPDSHHIYVISLQECAKKREKWVSAIKDHISGKSQFVFVGNVRLWDIISIILVRRQLEKSISHVRAETVACGAADMLGNKGGVAIGFWVFDTPLLFINSHFAARAEKLEKRENNYRRIINQLDMGIPGIDVLNQFRHVVWAGDLNYRIDKDWDEVLALMSKQEWVTLGSGDQLRAEMAQLKVFVGFKEGPVDFCPTYRWERTKNVPSNKRRQPPSWTDRVLWRSFPDTSDELSFERYYSCSDVFGSDHRPVVCLYTLKPRAPYQFNKLFHVSSPDAARNLHYEILVDSLKVVQLDDEESFDKELTVTITSLVLENKVTPPPLLFSSDSNSYALPNNVQLKLTPFIYDEDYLKTSHMLVTVTGKSGRTRTTEEIAKDVNVKQTADQADHLEGAALFGNGVLSLLRAFDKDGSSFNVILTRDGQCTGQLSGRLTATMCGVVNPEETADNYLNLRASPPATTQQLAAKR